MKISWVLLLAAWALASAGALANCISGDCRDGTGEARFDNGDRYRGTWRDGLMHGQGVYRFRTSARYEGEFREGAMHGLGTMYYTDGAVYTGQWAGNKKSGRGRLVKPSGKTLDGRWINGRYAGEAEAGIAHADVAAAGSAPAKPHTSKPPSSKPHTSKPPSSKPSRRQNAATVAPITSRPDRSTATATGHNGRLRDCGAVYCEEGYGRYRYRDGATYVGGFEDGHPSGLGKVTYANGDRYEGDWFGNAPDGRGTYTFANGRSVLGRWADGRLVERLYRNSAPDGPARALAEERQRRERPARASTSGVDPSPPPTERLGDGRTDMYAVVVGIGAYSAMQTLNYTDDDAYQMYAFLKSPEGGALADGQVEVLIDERATAEGIEAALADKLARADADDIVVFYYSGHGVDGYFIPVDFDGTRNLLSHERVEELFAGSAARHKLVLADACHSGGLLAAKAYNSRSTERLYEAFGKSDGGTALLLSSRTEEVSLEASGLRSGVFSHFIMRGMRGEADADADKIVTVNELFKYTYGRVREYTGNRQTPVLSGSYDRHMPVASLR